MSYLLVDKIIQMDGLTSGQKLVAIAFARHANDAGECFPSVSRIAKLSSMTDRGVQKIIAQLIDLGVIFCQRERGKVSNYVIMTPELSSPQGRTEFISKKPHPRTQFTSTPELSSPVPPNSVPKTPELSSPESIIEPINLNQSLNQSIVKLEESECVLSEQFNWLIQKAQKAINSPSLTDFTLLKVWLREGYSPQHILSVIEANAKKPKTALTSLAYFNGMIREKKPQSVQQTASHQPSVKQEFGLYVSYVTAEKNHDLAFKEMARRQKVRSTPEQLRNAYEEKYGHLKIVKS